MAPGTAASQNPALAAAVSQGSYAMHGSPLPPQGPQVQATAISQGSPAPPPASATPTSSTPALQAPPTSGPTGGVDMSGSSKATPSPSPSPSQGEKGGKTSEGGGSPASPASQAPVLTESAASKGVESAGSQTVEDPNVSLQPPHLEPEGLLGPQRSGSAALTSASAASSTPSSPPGSQPPSGVEGQGQRSFCGMVGCSSWHGCSALTDRDFFLIS